MGFTVEASPSADTLSALKSAAEANYGNAVTAWALFELVAGRQSGSAPPVAQRRSFLGAAYDKVIANLYEDSTYRRPLERMRDQAIADADQNDRGETPFVIT